MLRSRLSGTIIFSLAFVALGSVAYLMIYFEVPASKLTRDPAAIAGMHPLNGLLSNLGVLYWTATASICLFAALLLSTAPDWRTFFLYYGLFTALLLLDDLFMLHDRILPATLNINEMTLLGIYVLILLFGLFSFSTQIRESNFILLLAALIFFNCSIMIDLVPEDWSHLHHFFEDGSKYVGISTWTAYFVGTALDRLQLAQEDHQ
jgi:hypothetical protein